MSGYKFCLATVALGTFLAVAGCAWERRGPRTVPLTLTDAATGNAIRDAVVVSVVRSTGWFPYIKMESKPHPFDKVRVEGIAHFDPAKPVVLLPYHLPASGSALGLIINENPEVMVFREGYEPGGRVEAVLNGYASHWSYTQAGYEKGAALDICLTPLATPAPTASSSPANEDEPDHPNSILSDEGFWRELRSRYSRGSSKAEIAIICRCVWGEAEAFLRMHPRHQWTSAEQATLDWCREAEKGK